MKDRFKSDSLKRLGLGHNLLVSVSCLFTNRASRQLRMQGDSSARTADLFFSRLYIGRGPDKVTERRSNARCRPYFECRMLSHFHQVKRRLTNAAACIFARPIIGLNYLAGAAAKGRTSRSTLSAISSSATSRS